jgi:nucleotidyltransferase/DNA polymerase involved in DNA repair
MLARLATRHAKPAGSFHLLPGDVQEFMAPLEIMDLWGFGWATHKKAEEKLGATILGDLAKKNKSTLCDALGKGTGETLYKAIRGIDEHKLESDKLRKSVSCEINVRAKTHTVLPFMLISIENSMAYGLRITSNLRYSSVKWLKKWLVGWMPFLCVGGR